MTIEDLGASLRASEIVRRALEEKGLRSSAAVKVSDKIVRTSLRFGRP